MLTSAFIRREIDAINEKWREIQKGSERKGEELAIFTDSTSILIFGEASKNSWTRLAPRVASRSSFPRLSFWSSRSTAIIQSKVG